MSRVTRLTHEFVEYIPRELKDGVVYVSIPFATVIHKCCCGCGRQVVTPLAPAQWTLNFDGQSISLYPSIGNWGFPCRSHYWIKQNRVIWAQRWSASQIASAQRQDAAAVQAQSHAAAEDQREPQGPTLEGSTRRDGFFARWRKRLFGG